MMMKSFPTASDVLFFSSVSNHHSWFNCSNCDSDVISMEKFQDKRTARCLASLYTFNDGLLLN